MNACACTLVTLGILSFEVAFGQEVKTVRTSNGTPPSEVKQINNTPVIYIHKNDPSHPPSTQNPSRLRTTPPPSNGSQQRCIKKLPNQSEEGNNKKKELKEPVRSR